jgi:hypothetical protein
MVNSGFLYAERAPASLKGKDILGIPSLSIEIKARRELRLNEWLKQAEKRTGLPVLIHRPDGMGVAQVDLWPMTMRLKDGIQLLSYYDECVYPIGE